ncbi:hypothetical protein E9993_09465 [Labilibacter sediminis]|nr:hypothetical protein E9993_09465 [Labilibacter sediminis]
MISLLNNKNKLWYVIIFIIGGGTFSRCTTFLDDSKYSGPPTSLRYMSVDTLSIGSEFVTLRPTVLGGENATFSLDWVQGPGSEEILSEAFISESFSIDESDGYITVNEFSQLEPGFYSFDVKVSNPAGSDVFPGVFSFEAKKVAPTKIKYIPSIYSFYSDEVGVSTDAAFVNGGGPYSFVLDDPLNYFSIDPETGSITKDQVVDVDPGDPLEKVYDVSVSNELGSYTQNDAITIEIIDPTMGKIVHNNELTTPSVTNLGLLNAHAISIYGEYTATINDEEYTTTLVQGVNTGGYKGSRHYNIWHSYGLDIKLDRTGNGAKENRQFLSFKTASSKTECVAWVVTDSIDLTNATSATTEIQAYKRFIDNDFNQRFALLICDNADYVEGEIDPIWYEMEYNIAPEMLKWASPFSESDLQNGRQEFEIPFEFLGKKVRLALQAEHLNSSLGNLGRETYIYKWQVRAKN